MMRNQRPAALAIVVTLIGMIVASTGCGKGFAPMWSQANPETSFGFDPVARKVEFYSNDGRAMTAKRIAFKKGDTSFEADDLNITERSVENREANVQQLDAVERITGKMMEPLNTLAARIPLGPAPGSSDGGGISDAAKDAIKGIIEAEIKKRLPQAPGPQSNARPRMGKMLNGVRIFPQTYVVKPMGVGKVIEPEGNL